MIPRFRASWKVSCTPHNKVFDNLDEALEVAGLAKYEKFMRGFRTLSTCKKMPYSTDFNRFDLTDQVKLQKCAADQWYVGSVNKKG